MPGDTGQRELKLKVTEEGSEEAAAKQKRLAEAQREVSAAGKEGAAAPGGGAGATEQIKEQAEAQDKLNVSTGDYAAAAGAVGGPLGTMISAGQGAARVMADLGKVNLFSRDTLNKVTAALGRVKNALIALGAAGAALLSVQALMSAYQAYREEVEKLNEALKEQEEIQNRLKGEKFEARTEIAAELVRQDKATTENMNEAVRLYESAVGKGAERGAALQAAVAGAGEGVTGEQALAGAGRIMAGKTTATGADLAAEMQRLTDEQVKAGIDAARFAQRAQQEALQQEAQREFGAASAVSGQVQFGAGTEAMMRRLTGQGMSEEKARPLIDIAAREMLNEEARQAGRDQPFQSSQVVRDPLMGLRSAIGTSLAESAGQSPEQAEAAWVLTQFLPEHLRRDRVAGGAASVTINQYHQRNYNHGRRNPIRGGRPRAGWRDRSGRG